MPKLGTEIRSTAVMTAIYALHRRHGQWPTAEDVAEFLEVEVAPVKARLRELRTARLFRNRQRGGQQVWMPWEEF